MAGLTVDSTMRGEEYKQLGVGQLDAHSITHEALHAAVGRLVQSRKPGGALNICDLGCASGGNTIKVAQRVVSALKEAAATPVEVSYSLNDLPSNDWATLTSEVLAAGLQSDSFHVDFVPRSFYQPLFPSASVNLSLSYITLHILPAPPCDLGAKFCHANESGVPEEKVATWRSAAHDSLVSFLRLRAAELVDGGEGLYLMVTESGWINPAKDKPTVFSTAIGRAVKKGALSQSEADKATINYYFRTDKEVEGAAAAVGELEVLGVHSHTVSVTKDQPVEANSGLAWSIYSHMLQTSMGASDKAMEVVRQCCTEVIAEEFGSAGLKIRYAFLHVRRRPRLTVDSTMRGKEYKQLGVGQLDAHSITHQALHAAVGRLVQSRKPGRALRICDLGCASGGNAMQVAQRVVSALNEAKGATPVEVSYALNDLPSNDWATLTSELLTAGLQSDSFHVRCVPRSFYQPLFPSASVDLSLSYITLHILPAPPCDLGAQFCHANESGVPGEKVAIWRSAAHESLVSFLRLRAAELVDGGEGLYLMVTESDWISPAKDKPSVFSTAIGRAVMKGALSPSEAEKATINYYFRTDEEVAAAAAAVGELEVLGVHSHTVSVTKDQPVEANSGLAWSIYSNMLQTSMGASDQAMEVVRQCCTEVIAEEFGSAGVQIRYAFLHVRRRPRA